jgi:hypothetical protein
MRRPVTERMEEARCKMVAQRRRVPRVFFLSPADFDEFAETKPPTVEAIFSLPLGSKPSPMTCLAFEGVAVRSTDRAPDKTGRIRSNLFSTCGVSVGVPWQ